MADRKKTTGLIHIYCGNGKGKTTTGMGLCTRAAGYGYKVLIYQFMKDNKTSERKILEQVSNVTWIDGLAQEKFSFQMTEEEKKQRRAFYAEQLKNVTELAAREDYDVLFLDEVIYTIRAGLLEEALVTEFLDHKPEKLEVIMTGQEPGEALIERADYVSEICMRKHPFQQGIPARPGIER
ncbi:MAG: cob(I)yrinic acid a,c-diamide adenosyltransferase [Eubacteriales bacterium]|nr:cob(I)yrinic acid a,c-diamide adenosyltransferase [Eubacteriales bacterium]